MHKKEGYCMKYQFGNRLLSLLLAVVMVVGLLPGVIIPEAEAATADEIAAQTTSYLSSLKSAYSSLQIPKTKAKYVTTGNVKNLAGTYFMVIYGAHHRMMNYGVSSTSRFDRLNGNCYDDPPSEGGNHSYIPGLHINIANWKTENGEFTGINGMTPENLLDYAVEFRPNTVTVNYNESYADGDLVGWTAYTKWEYGRVNKATGGTLGFGPYMGVNGIMSKSDTAYNILSLHPNRTAAGTPWVGTYDTWGNAGYRSSAMPIFIKPNTDGRTFKMYKVDFQNATNCYTYWFGVDEYYSDIPINAHTISQIVREDKNLNENTYAGHNTKKYYTDWELFQVSPSTLALYKALYKAKSYVVNGNTTNASAEQYLEFLRYTAAAMAEYNENRGTFNDNTSDPGRIKMDNIASNLNTFVARLDSPSTPTDQGYSQLRATISGLNWPYGERITSISSSTSMNGHWLIMSGESRGPAGTLYGIDPAKARGSWNDKSEPIDNGHRGSEAVDVRYYIADNSVWGAVNPPYRTILKLSGNGSSFSVQLYDGQYWNLNRLSNGSSIWGNFDLGSATNLGVTAADSGRFYLHTVNKDVYLYTNGWTIRAKYDNESVTQNKQHFFKINEELYNLRHTLEEARHYLVDNSTVTFDQENYNAFLRAVNDGINYYSTRYTILDSNLDANERASIDLKTRNLLIAMANLAAGKDYTAVLDYGKSTDMDMKQVADSLCLGADKTVTYCGVSLTGRAGFITLEPRTDLSLVGKGTSLDTATHHYFMTDATTLRLTPKTIMEGAQTLYATFKVVSTGDVNYKTRYITKAITLIPATVTYYETDFDNGIHLLERNDDSLFVHFGADDDTTWGATSNLTYKEKANGVLPGTVTGGDPHIEMTNKPDSFHYLVKSTDVVKVRIKVAAGTGTNLQVFFMTETNERPTGGISTADVSFTADGNWQTITLPIFDAVVGKTIRGLRIDPVSNYSKNGDFEVDWIYVGPDVEMEPYIVMGFGPGDHSVWTQSGGCTNLTRDTSDGGYLKGNITGSDPYMTMTAATRRFGYRVKQGDTVRVRVRSEAGTGTGFEVYFLTDLNTSPTEEYVVRTDDYNPDGTWQIVEIPLTGNIVGREIRGLRLDPGVNNTYKNSGTFAIDWVYVGPEEEVKKPIVIEFDDNDGIEWYNLGEVNNLTKANGVLKGTIAGNDPRVQMTNASSTLHYTLKDTDVVKIRIRSDANTGKGLDIFFLTDGNAGPTGACLARCGEYVPNGQWQTVTMQLQHCAIGTTISGFRLDPTYNDTSNEYPEGGTFEYDWVYIGPDFDVEPNLDLQEDNDPEHFEKTTFSFVSASESSAWEFKGDSDATTAKAQYSNSANENPIYPSNSLFFGFGNTAADQSHYNSTYSSINYDNPSAISNHYYTSTNKDALHTSIAIDNATGTLELSAVTGPDGGYYAWFDTVNGTYGTWPLSYNPKDAEIIQIRFKMEGFELGTGRSYPYFTIQYFNAAKDDIKYQVGKTAIPLDYLSNGEYMTATVRLNDSLGQTFRQQSAITKLRIFFGDVMCISGTKGKITIDYLYIGPEKGFTEPHTVYGYDASYDRNPTYSGGSTFFTIGSGVPMINYKTDAEGNPILDAQGNRINYIDYEEGKTYTEASFPFTGTGFDIISRTGKDQGSLRVVVCDTEGVVRKTVTVLNKGETELYQIPVVSVRNLPYGSYRVHIFINAPYTNTIVPTLNRGGEFYFDAVRIYGTINTQDTDETATNAYEVYQKHGEADPAFKELRDILIDAGKGITDAKIDGVVYMDNNGETSTSSIAKYDKDGPNNEVYLASGNAVAFKLEVEGDIPASIDIGAKSPDGTPVSMKIGVGAVVSDAKSGGTTRTIQTATDLYYSMDIPASLWQTSGNTRYVYVMISNTASTGILSITHVKYAYDVPKTQTAVATTFLRFVVDPIMIERLLSPCEHLWDEGTELSAPTCEGCGKVQYTCTLCEETLTEDLPPVGHDYVYTQATAIYHTVTCKNCDHVSGAPHAYTDGECYCGQAEPMTPVEEPGWKMGHTLDLASDISVNFAIEKSALAGFDMDTVYIESLLDVFEGNAKVGEKLLRLYPEDKGSYYYFTLDGLTAVQMNNNIISVLHGTKDGQEYYSPVDTYSIATYAYSQLEKEKIPAALKTLCADLLCYGAKAQIFKGYRTDALADSAMSDTHGAYLSDIDSVTFGNTNLYLNDLDNAPVAWVGKSLNLDSKVELKFIFSVKNYPGDLENLSLQVAYTDVKGNPKSATVENFEVYNEDKGYYSFTLDTLLAAELRSVVSAQIYAGKTPVSPTLLYSADTYGNNKTGALGDLCKALFAYSDSAKAYFQD